MRGASLPFKYCGCNVGVSWGSEVGFRRIDALLTRDNCVLEDMFYAVGGGSVVVVLTISFLSIPLLDRVLVNL
jgi:hypothetical protein